MSTRLSSTLLKKRVSARFPQLSQNQIGKLSYKELSNKLNIPPSRVSPERMKVNTNSLIKSLKRTLNESNHNTTSMRTIRRKVAKNLKLNPGFHNDDKKFIRKIVNMDIATRKSMQMESKKGNVNREKLATARKTEVEEKKKHADKLQEAKEKKAHILKKAKTKIERALKKSLRAKGFKTGLITKALTKLRKPFMRGKKVVPTTAAMFNKRSSKIKTIQPISKGLRNNTMKSLRKNTKNDPSAHRVVHKHEEKRIYQLSMQSMTPIFSYKQSMQSIRKRRLLNNVRPVTTSGIFGASRRASGKGIVIGDSRSKRMKRQSMSPAVLEIYKRQQSGAYNRQGTRFDKPTSVSIKTPMQSNEKLAAAFKSRVRQLKRLSMSTSKFPKKSRIKVTSKSKSKTKTKMKQKQALSTILENNFIIRSPVTGMPVYVNSPSPKKYNATYKPIYP